MILVVGTLPRCLHELLGHGRGRARVCRTTRPTACTSCRDVGGVVRTPVAPPAQLPARSAGMWAGCARLPHCPPNCLHVLSGRGRGRAHVCVTTRSSVCTFCRDVGEVVCTSSAPLAHYARSHIIRPTFSAFHGGARNHPHGLARGHDAPGISATSRTTAHHAFAQHAWRSACLHVLHLDAQLCPHLEDTSHPNVPSANICAFVACTRPGIRHRYAMALRIRAMARLGPLVL
ncbi:hypothetical protein F511_28096 [Dorcoceras hygrometricum]|uniref:Uncharacterized protein n=1 Tax=Dorcoceras hygrometricum TaxID=472368 RepID=A0A2Z7A868_9LAMI|nr:hypothetical protein F511_28096 [Dorcoceras hygrometricum]